LDEIAAVTGAPLGTVKSRLYRGLNILMERLQGAQA
jgi:DNA-directed RNA polymerase specialized sigma24 family protein